MRIELDDCLASDRRRLKALLRDLKSAQGAKKDKARADFDALAKRSAEIVQKRRARLPASFAGWRTRDFLCVAASRAEKCRKIWQIPLEISAGDIIFNYIFFQEVCHGRGW